MIIEQFKQVNDEALIQASKNLLVDALKNEPEHFDAPEEHQQSDMDRITRVTNNPEQFPDWEETEKMPS